MRYTKTANCADHPQRCARRILMKNFCAIADCWNGISRPTPRREITAERGWSLTTVTCVPAWLFNLVFLFLLPFQFQFSGNQTHVLPSRMLRMTDSSDVAGQNKFKDTCAAFKHCSQNLVHRNSVHCKAAFESAKWTRRNSCETFDWSAESAAFYSQAVACTS